MSKESNPGSTVCMCGTHISVIIKKPTAVSATVKPLKCKRCDSRYLVRCEKHGKDFKFDFDIIQISPFAEAVVRWRIDHPGQTLNMSDLPWHRRAISWVTRRLSI